MPLQIRPGTEADADQITTIRNEAFANTIWTRSMFPNGMTDDLSEKRKAGILEDFQKQEVVHMVVEDSETGTVVASSKWLVYKQERPESEWDVPFTQKDMGEEANQEAVDRCMGKLHSKRREYIQGRPHMALDRLETLPEYHGKGAGSMLMKWGTAYADELDVPTWLESTKAGYKLYKKYGFRDVECLTEDCAKWGVNEICWTMCMERPSPGGVSAVS